MKKAVLFKPELLAEVEHESPAVYEIFCNTPFSTLEYVDYGIPSISMFMPKELLLTLQSGLSSNKKKYSEQMTALRNGWILGLRDFFLDDDETVEDPLELITSKVDYVATALNFQFITFDMVMDEDNFAVRDTITYSIIAYQEAQTLWAWKLVLANHKNVNELFVQTNAAWEKVQASQMRS